MANDTTVKPIKIDTAGASAILTKGLYVTKIEWDAEAAAAADNVVVQDQHGNRKWGSTANGANYKEEAVFPGNGGQGEFFDGLLVPTLDAGTIYVHFSVNYN